VKVLVSDLWPLYTSGEAIADTRTFVDDFLAQDPEFARMLDESQGAPLQHLVDRPPLPPDHEMKTLALITPRLAGPPQLLLLALVFSGLAFGRIVSDTSFDVSPRAFIATAAVAACFWLAFLVKLFRGRRSILLRVRR
jgi:hypothetical protein